MYCKGNAPSTSFLWHYSLFYGPLFNVYVTDGDWEDILALNALQFGRGWLTLWQKLALVFRHQRIQVKSIRMDGSERIPNLSDNCCWIFFLYNTTVSRRPSVLNSSTGSTAHWFVRDTFFKNERKIMSALVSVDIGYLLFFNVEFPFIW